MSSKNRRPIAPLMTRCGFPQFLFMRLLAVYFLLSDITILYAGRKNISARKNWRKASGARICSSCPIPTIRRDW